MVRSSCFVQATPSCMEAVVTQSERWNLMTKMSTMIGYQTVWPKTKGQPPVLHYIHDINPHTPSHASMHSSHQHEANVYRLSLRTVRRIHEYRLYTFFTLYDWHICIYCCIHWPCYIFQSCSVLWCLLYSATLSWTIHSRRRMLPCVWSVLFPWSIPTSGCEPVHLGIAGHEMVHPAWQQTLIGNIQYK